MKTNEYEEIYGQEGSGFRFDYNNRRLGKSKSISKNEIEALESSKYNTEDTPLLVYCQACEVYMDFKEGPEKQMFDSWRVCPVCNARVKEETLYKQLDRENAAWLISNQLDD